MYSYLVEQAEMEIGQWDWLLVLDVASSLQLARSAAGDKYRQVHVIMHIGVAHSAAEKVYRMVQQRSVAVGSRFQFVEEVGEEGHVIGIDLGQLRKLFRIIRVMR